MAKTSNDPVIKKTLDSMELTKKVANKNAKNNQRMRDQLAKLKKPKQKQKSNTKK